MSPTRIKMYWSLLLFISLSHRLSDVKEIITDLINKLQSEALPEANHKQDRDDELDLETQVETLFQVRSNCSAVQRSGR